MDITVVCSAPQTPHPQAPHASLLSMDQTTNSSSDWLLEGCGEMICPPLCVDAAGSQRSYMLCPLHT